MSHRTCHRVVTEVSPRLTGPWDSVVSQEPITRAYQFGVDRTSDPHGSQTVPLEACTCTANTEKGMGPPLGSNAAYGQGLRQAARRKGPDHTWVPIPRSHVRRSDHFARRSGHFIMESDRPVSHAIRGGPRTSDAKMKDHRCVYGHHHGWAWWTMSC